MYIDIEGDEGLPALVLLHGGIGTGIGHWGKLAPGLAGSFRVYMPDLPGHGQTPLPDDVPYTMAVHVTAVRELLQQLGPPVHVAAFSMGAHAALALAAQQPELFASLTLVGASLREHAGLQRWRTNFEPTRFVAANPLWARYLSRVHAPLGGPEAYKDVLARDSQGLSSGEHQAQDFAGLTCPVLLIRGDRDWAVEPTQYAELLAVLGDLGEEMVVPHGGHDVQITRWQIIEPALHDFLRRATS